MLRDKRSASATFGLRHRERHDDLRNEANVEARWLQRARQATPFRARRARATKTLALVPAVLSPYPKLLRKHARRTVRPEALEEKHCRAMVLGVPLNVLRERFPVTLTKLTQAQAARAARTSRTSIWRAVRDGRLSAERLEDGSLRIDASELLRVYPRADIDRARRSGDSVTRTGTSDSQRAPKERIDGELRALTAHLDELKRDKERLVRELEDAAAERRQLLSMLEAKDRLIEDKRERKRWRWFRTRGTA